MGGLRRPDKGHMATLFSLIIAWAVVSMSAFVLLPYIANRHDDSIWSEPKTLLIWSILCTVSVAHGMAAFMMANGRGRSPWFFLLGAVPGLLGSLAAHKSLDMSPVWGAVLFPLSLLLCAAMLRSAPEAPPVEPPAPLRRMDRLFFMMGNIWFGIAQLAVLLGVTLWGTIHENMVGAKGNEAAYALVYAAPWLGALYVLFFVTIYCATMRKYPFRIPQIGWLVTHTGILSFMVGCMIMFWGSYSGRMLLFEGDTKGFALSSEEREMVLNVPGANFEERQLISCDRNPNKSDVEEKFVFEYPHPQNSSTERFEVEIDRYYSSAHRYQRLQPVPIMNDTAPAAGVNFRVTAPGYRNELFLWEKSGFSAQNLGVFELYLHRVRTELYFRGLTHRYDDADQNRGTLTVLDQSSGKKLTSVAVVPGERFGDGRGGATLPGHERDLSGGLRITPTQYFSNFHLDQEQKRILDATPGNDVNPAMRVEVSGPKGIEEYLVTYDGQSIRYRPNQGEPFYAIKLEYLCVPEVTFPKNSMTFVLGPGQKQSLLIVDGEENTRIERLTIDESYKLSDAAPIRLTPLAILDNAELDQGVEPTTKSEAFRALRATIRHKGDVQQVWIEGQSRPTNIKVGGHTVSLGYLAKRRELGFDLSCLDFRQINYPNSTKPKKFETNVILRDEEAKIDEAVLIDMNHPLSHRGYRFFNSSPILDEKSNRRGIVFQVGRNPGYPVILAGSLIITLGFVLVFFMKPSMRRWDARRKTTRQSTATTMSAKPIA